MKQLLILLGFLLLLQNACYLPSQNNLIRSIQDGDIKKVKFLIDEGYDVNKPGGKKTWSGPTPTLTPLNTAVVYDHFDLAKLLLEKGASIDGDGKADTPILTAIAVKKYQFTEFLIKNGANVNLSHPRMKGHTPLSRALRIRNTKTKLRFVELLLKNGARLNPRQAKKYEARNDELGKLLRKYQ